MTLRVRMGLAAGVAVAIAVIAVAFTAYAGTRSELRGQVDSSLQSLTGSLLARVGIPATGHPGQGSQLPRTEPAGKSGEPSKSGLGFVGTPSSSDPDDRDEGLGLDDHTGPAFGGAPGTVILIRKDGTIYTPRGQKQSIPPDARAKALAQRGTGRYFADRERGAPTSGYW